MDISQPNFEEYKNKCVEAVLSLQDEFKKLYDIDSYAEWYYDHDLGVFEFKAGAGENLYFTYVKVGSFSTKTNTWNWGWANKSTPLHVTKPLEKVKAFGEINNYDPLIQELIDGDDYTGWEMTAISAKLLNAIGAYRVPHEHLFIYFIFRNELTQQEYETRKDNYVACNAHGMDRVAFVCQHLIKDEGKGFHEAFDSDPLIEEEEEHQAWCDECEKVRLKHREWTDEAMAFANIKVVCDQCYFEIKERNQVDDK